MKRECYFYSCGTIFDKNDRELLYDCWNCNGNSCKSDVCNGLWCDDYGIFFSKEAANDYIKTYVDEGIVSTYGYLKKINIELPSEVWNNIENTLINSYNYDSLHDARKCGFIPVDFYEVIEDYSPYWEQPDISYLKQNANIILKDVIKIKKEEELEIDTINWINQNIYFDRKNANEVEM